MSELAEKLKRAFILSLKEQSQLAAETGYSVSMVDKVINGRPGPSVKAKAAVARALGVEIDIESELKNRVVPSQKFTPMKLTTIPVFDVSLPAGRWSEAVEQREARDADDFIQIPAGRWEAAFALRIHGQNRLCHPADKLVAIRVPLDANEPSWPIDKKTMFKPKCDNLNLPAFPIKRYVHRRSLFAAQVLPELRANIQGKNRPVTTLCQ